MPAPSSAPSPAKGLFRYETVVRFQNCDPAGIVYFPNFINMSEAAIEDWWRDVMGERYEEWLFERRLALPRVKVVCEFSKPCRMGDRLELTLLVTRIGRSSLEIETVGRVGGEERLKITTIMVGMSLETHKSVPLPDALRAKLEAYRALGAAGA